MKILIRSMQIDVLPALKRHIDEKIGLLENHLDPKHVSLAEARVEVGRPSGHHHKGEVFYAEVNLKIGKEFMRCSVEDSDLYSAVNKCRDDLERQISKDKTKHVSKRRKAERK